MPILAERLDSKYWKTTNYFQTVYVVLVLIKYYELVRQSLSEINRESRWAFFRIERFAGKRSLPPPPSSFLLSPHFPRVPNAKMILRSARTGTLATQATTLIIPFLLR